MFCYFLFLGVEFGSLAALSAFLIMWGEYERHQLETRKLWEICLQSALMAFLLFVSLTLLVGFLWTRYF